MTRATLSQAHMNSFLFLTNYNFVWEKLTSSYSNVKNLVFYYKISIRDLALINFSIIYFVAVKSETTSFYTRRKRECQEKSCGFWKLK